VNKRITVDHTNGHSLFVLSRLSAPVKTGEFECSIAEYDEYLTQEAWRAQSEFVAITWLLRGRNEDRITAYMSLINDAITLSSSEKELHHLDYPFRTIPAMKIAKLAVSKTGREQFKGIGSYMLYLAQFIAVTLNEHHSACRFLTVDADIEHDEGVLAFYQKNGFMLNAELYNKNRKTISMRRDVLV
jgi:ribosomal protein S18 acetylase RimI-like enzyme